jgi:hypothetical protein
MEAGHHAAFDIQHVLSIPAALALAVLVEADPTAAEGIGRPWRGMAPFLGVFPDGIGGFVEHLKTTHRGLPARHADGHREPAYHPAVLQEAEQAPLAIEDKGPIHLNVDSCRSG